VKIGDRPQFSAGRKIEVCPRFFGRLRRAILLSFLLFAGAVHAAFSGAIVDAAFVAKAMARGAILWDVRSAEQYRTGHLPGAVNIDHVSGALLDEKTQLFLPIEKIAARLGGAGIDLTREIVVYGNAGSAYPYFAEFALDYFGARKVNVFHDGIEGWKAAKRPVSTVDVARRPLKVRPFANPSMLVTTSEVISRAESPDVQFVDVRRLGEFNGDEAETLRGGHIPGAVHIPYNEQLADPDAPRRLMAKETTDASGMKLKKVSELRKLYAGLDRRKETIVYCHTGIRAAMTAAVLTRLGFRSVRLYHASWFHYGNEPEAPVE
jgi:thiosulfate/3-mercaptopyruvate sulfurtransferase